LTAGSRWSRRMSRCVIVDRGGAVVARASQVSEQTGVPEKSPEWPSSLAATKPASAAATSVAMTTAYLW
jgi:hypothetical protein